MAEELSPRIHQPDWRSPMYAPHRPVPTWERLNSPSSRVFVKNTSEAQRHVVVDKYNVGHELKPGERKELEMLNEEIAYFQEMRLPDRFHNTDPPTPMPPHAILIEGVPSLIDEQRRLRDQRMAAAAAEREAEQAETREKRARGAKGRFA